MFKLYKYKCHFVKYVDVLTEMERILYVRESIRMNLYF